MKQMLGLVVVLVVVAACGSDGNGAVTATPGSVPAGSSADESTESTSPASTSPVTPSDGCADVVAVEVSGDGPYRFSVTVSSVDTGWDKYADEWRIESSSGEILGVRELAHPHVDEQPFTRSLDGVEIAGGSVVIAARDSVEGYCGETVTVALDD